MAGPDETSEVGQVATDVSTVVVEKSPFMDAAVVVPPSSEPVGGATNDPNKTAKGWVGGVQITGQDSQPLDLSLARAIRVGSKVRTAQTAGLTPQKLDEFVQQVHGDLTTKLRPHSDVLSRAVAVQKGKLTPSTITASEITRLTQRTQSQKDAEAAAMVEIPQIIETARAEQAVAEEKKKIEEALKQSAEAEVVQTVKTKEAVQYQQELAALKGQIQGTITDQTDASAQSPATEKPAIAKRGGLLGNLRLLFTRPKQTGQTSSVDVSARLTESLPQDVSISQRSAMATEAELTANQSQAIADIQRRVAAAQSSPYRTDITSTIKPISDEEAQRLAQTDARETELARQRALAAGRTDQGFTSAKDLYRLRPDLADRDEADAARHKEAMAAKKIADKERDKTIAGAAKSIGAAGTALTSEQIEQSGIK